MTQMPHNRNKPITTVLWRDIIPYVVIFTTLLFPAYAADNGCVINIPLFQENSNTTIDLSDPKQKCKIEGAEWNDEGFLKFNGSNTIVTIPTTGIQLSDFTFSFWINPEIVHHNQSKTAIFKGHGNGYNVGYICYTSEVGGAKKIKFNINFGDKSPRAFEIGNISRDTFSHIIIRYDHKELTGFINGKITGSIPEIREATYVNQGIQVGAGTSDYPRFKGIISRFKVFDRAISSDEIMQLSSESTFLKNRVKNNSLDKKTFVAPVWYDDNKLTAPNFSICRNLVQNPSFESAFHYWCEDVRPMKTFLDKRQEIDTTTARTGKKSLHLYGYAEGDTVMANARSFAIPVEANADYTVSFYTKGTKGERVKVSIWTGVWPVWPVSKTVILTDAWERHTFPFTAPNAIVSVTFAAAQGKANFDAWIDDVQVEVGKEAGGFTQKPLQMELITGTTGDNMFEPDENVKMKLLVNAFQKSRGILTYTIVDFYKKIILSNNSTIALENNTGAAIAIDLTDQLGEGRSGLYLMKCTYQLDDGYMDYDYFRFGIRKSHTVTNRHENLFGYYSIWKSAPNEIIGMERSKKMGLGSFQIHSGNESISREMNDLAGKNNATVMCVPYPGSFLKLVTMREYKPGMNIDLEKLGNAVFARVKEMDYINYWKLANEPDHRIFDSQEQTDIFMKILLCIAENVRKANPKAKILSPDPSNMYPGNGINEIKVMLQNGLLKLCDIIAIHPYRPRPEDPDFDGHTKIFLAMLAEYGYTGDIWFTEGIDNMPYRIAQYGLEPTRLNDHYRGGPLSYDIGLGEQISAAYQSRMWLVALKYASRVKVLAGLHRDHIMDLAWTPYAGYWSVNTLANILGNADFVRDVNISSKVRSYLFIDEKNRQVFVFWNIDAKIDDGLEQPVRLSLPFQENDVRVFSLMGATIALDNGTLPALPVPTFVRADKISAAELDNKLAQIKVSGDVSTAVNIKINMQDANTATVAIDNNTSRKLNGNTAIFVNDKKILTESISLEPGKGISLTVPALLPEQQLIKLPVRAEFVSSDRTVERTFSETLRIMIIDRIKNSITIDGDLSDWGENKGITIANRFVDFSPPKGKEKIGWKGEQDLSAKLFCGWDESGLYLAFDVTDDVVSLPPEVKYGWQYDSVQLYFDTFCDAKNHPERNGFDNNDYNYDISTAGSETVVQRAVVPEWQLCFLKKGPANEVKRAFRKNVKGYTYELFFPASEIAPLKIKKGSIYGFACLINDNDNDFRKRGLTLTPENTEPFMRPELYPIVILR
ncbi:MAG: hypothetical protein A2096_00765 [Spirochaetes bacterium GWF1_41_5]|nr:MAG: hypothetical protein A2096_00765 [Spirochaetes bacterium GWF1_41_5]